jgi:glycosyltransferase involved in cell wall biosynthesis
MSSSGQCRACRRCEISADCRSSFEHYGPNVPPSFMPTSPGPYPASTDSLLLFWHGYQLLSPLHTFMWIFQRNPCFMPSHDSLPLALIAISLSRTKWRDSYATRSIFQLVHNGIPLAPFNRPANTTLRATLTQATERPIVLMTARLHEQKGHRYLIEAAAQVPEAIFVLAGEGSERVSLEAQAKELGIDDRIIFLGFREDIPDLLANCDLFVLPSRSWRPWWPPDQ